MFRLFHNCMRLLRIMGIMWRHGLLLFWRVEMGKAEGVALARALEEMGPTFIKLGQVLSTRSDLVGQDVAEALGGLRDQLPPFSTGTARAIITDQLGKPVEEIFATFDNQAAAAASIAQVHFATLHDGREVAVKILRPGIAKAFSRDVALFYWLSGLAEYFRPEWHRFRLREVVQMFEEVIRLELDLRFEAGAAMQLRANLINDANFYVPEAYWDYTAEHVLTLERIRGIPIGDVEAVTAAGHDKARLVDIAAISFFNQVFRDGFFHADMHPGNLFVLPSGSIAVVDFGIMGRLDRKSRIYLAQILHGFLNEDYVNLAKVHFDAGLVPGHKSVDNFALALMAITKPIIGRNLGEISVARLLGQLFATAEAFEMEVQPHLLLLQKNMVIAEGVGRMLNPHVNMWEVAKPLVEDWARENLGAKARIQDHLDETVSLLKALPAIVRGAEAALARVSDGGLKLHPETIDRMRAQRARIHRDWLWFAWTALAVFGLAYITR